jgi:glycosyltransferase involved in cell wall biosynthesis
MKKVLLITYYWPPAGGPGVQRWLRFVTYLRDFGVEPVLYIPDNPVYPLLDTSLLDEVPPDIRIYRNKITEPMQWAGRFLKKDIKRISSGIISEHKPSLAERVLLWIRGNFFIPDARVLWVRPSVACLKKVLKTENIDTIVTTGPPHSLHLIGLYLKKETGIKWVADFRDPWTSIGYHKKLRLAPLARNKHKRLEKQVLNTADKILVTSSTTARELEEITSQPVRVITNGYEAMDYSEESPEPDRLFTLSHIGSLLSGRNPEALWKALQQLTEENKEFRTSFRLRFAGVVSPEVLESIRQHGLEPFLELLEYMPHSRIIKIQRQSQILLLIEINSPETRGILPGKLFEYLASKRPVLAVGPEDWEAGDIIREARAGTVFNYGSGDEIKKTVFRWFEKYREGSLQVASRGIQKFSRKELTRSLAKELLWE